jgi:integrase
VLLEEWMRIIDRDRSPRTAYGYRCLIDQRIVPTIGDVPLPQLEPRQLDAWYAQLDAEGLAPRTVRNVHAVLRTALGQAMRWGWISRNVAELGSPPSIPSDRRRTLPDDLVCAGLDAAMLHDPDFGTMVGVAAAMGCRRGELRAPLVRRRPRPGHRVDLAGDRLGPPRRPGREGHEDPPGTPGARRRRDRRRPRGAPRARARAGAPVEVTVSPDAFVFSTDADGLDAVPPDRVSHTWRRICRRTGVDGVRLHDLRHWHATYLLGRRVPLEVVSERLGPGLKSTTHDFYAHASPAHEELVAAELGAAFARRRGAIGSSSG